MRLRHLHLLLLVVTLPVALHARWAGGGKAPGVAYCKLKNTTNCGGSLRRFVPFGYIYTTATRCFAKRQSAPTFADIDGDGVAELITGQAPQPDGWIKEHEFEGSDGGLWTRFGYYKKTGDATNGDSAGPIYGAVYPDAQYTPRVVGAQFPSTPANPPRNGAPYPFPADMFPDTKNILHPNAKKNSNNDGYGSNKDRTLPNRYALADIDLDGDLDMFSSWASPENSCTAYQPQSMFWYFENIGDAQNPNFVNRKDHSILSAVDPYIAPPHCSRVSEGGVAKSKMYAHQPSPTFVDIDGDGDPDLVIGVVSRSSQILFFENIGQNSGDVFVPEFVQRTETSLNPFKLIDGAGMTGRNMNPTYGMHPSFSDVDGDGDFDLLIATPRVETFMYWENVGSRFNPAFTQRIVPALNPFYKLGFSQLLDPFLIGPDSTKQTDPLSPFQRCGTLADLKKYGGGNIFERYIGSELGSKQTMLPTPTFHDFDGDGHEDLLVGSHSGLIYIFRSEESSIAPFVRQRGDDNVFLGVSRSLGSHIGYKSATPSLGTSCVVLFYFLKSIMRSSFLRI